MTQPIAELWKLMAETFFVAFIAAVIVTPVAIKVAPKIGAMDIPKDGRRMHSTAMPRFGGIAILAGIIVSLAVFSSKYKLVLAQVALFSGRFIAHMSIMDRGVFAAVTGCVLIYILGRPQEPQTDSEAGGTDRMCHYSFRHGA